MKTTNDYPDILKSLKPDPGKKPDINRAPEVSGAQLPREILITEIASKIKRAYEANALNNLLK